MTTDELNTIVAAVVAELEKSGVDFDYKIDAPLDTDTIFVIRGTAPNYQGVTVTWKGLLDIITAQATQAKTDAETAKNAANTILSQVTTKESNVSTMKSEVSEMKTSVETTKSQVEGMKNAVETTKGQVETMKTSIETTKGEVETMKTSIETSKSQVETMKTSIETTKSQVETLKSESETAKETATQKAAETTQAKGDVESMKASIERTVADFNALADQKKSEVESVYQTDLNELKGDLSKIDVEFRKVSKSIIKDEPYITISALAPFVNGRLFDGVLSTKNAGYRVSTDTKIRIDEKTTFHIKDGFKASFQFFNDDGTFKIAGAFVTGQYTVNPIYGNNFKIMIARVTENESEIADIDEFTSAITVELHSIKKINADITKINADITEIKNVIGTNTTLPSYWVEYLNTKKSEIISAKCSIGNHGVYFAYFTDYHNSANVGYTAKILKWLKENTGLNTIIFGGDILKIESTREECLNGLNNFATLFRDLDMMYVFGNHDKNPYGTTENQLNELEDCYPLLFQSNEDKNNILHTGNLFYYFDNPTQKVRFMVLNTHNSTQEIVNDTEQISFMVETLNSTPEGWNIVVLPHIHYELNSGVIEESSASSFVDKIIGDFVNRKSGEKYNVAYDFTQAKANVCSIISGHIHNDYNEMKTYGVPSITTVCDAINAQAEYINPTGTRSIGTVTEQAIDLFFIDTKEKTINAIRIGFGENRSFTFN